MALLVRQAGPHLGSTFHERVAEWLLAACMVNWGVILHSADDLYGIASGVPFGGLARIASQEAWSWFCIFVGGTRLAALFINGWVLPQTFHIRAFTSFLSVLFWATIAFSLMFVANRPTAGLAAYPLFVPIELWCLYRTGRDLALHNAVQEATT